MATHYEILGVSPEASLEDIGNAYRFLAPKFHPDLNKGREEEARRRFVRMQEAFEVLSNDYKRGRYDQQLMQAAEQKQPTTKAKPEPEPEPEPVAARPQQDWADEPLSLNFSSKRKPVGLRKRKSGRGLAVMFFILCVAAAGAILYPLISKIKPDGSAIAKPIGAAQSAPADTVDK